ncbi:MAG: phage integrase N-terminal SAM-like domain-containing protein [Acidobacteria bacterium]|nr:phage integrase N-terminal SAM-like domain-containing protein [Acidobacteriota bacterium]
MGFQVFGNFANKRHASELGPANISAFLSYLASNQHVAASTQNQALNSVPRAEPGRPGCPQPSRYTVTTSPISCQWPMGSTGVN